MGLEIMHTTPFFYRLERYVIDLIEGKKSGALACVMRALLGGLSHCYAGYNRIRNFAYDRGWIPSYTSCLPTVCVGNITAGGTGKTPLLSLLVEKLRDEMKISLLSRGYRASLEKGKKSVSLRRNPQMISPEICGDEPCMLARRFPEVEYYVGKNRKASLRALEEGPVDIALLDDGFQCRSLRFDKQIVMLSHRDLFGKRRFLPLGYLRDHPRRLCEADLIAIHGTEKPRDFAKLKAEVENWTNAPVIGTKLKIVGIKPSQSCLKPSVGVFCGLGSPDDFFDETRRYLGSAPVEEWALLDHQRPDYGDLRAFASLCKEKGADLLLCSEKDYVKIPKSWRTALPIAHTETRMEVVFHEEQFSHFIQTCLSLRRRDKRH